MKWVIERDKFSCISTFGKQERVAYYQLKECDSKCLFDIHNLILLMFLYYYNK